MNPFNSNNNSNNFNMSYTKNLYNILKTSNNPIQVLDILALQNPQLRPALELVKNNNNYEQVFRTLCSQKGINADEFIKNIQANNT